MKRIVIVSDCSDVAFNEICAAIETNLDGYDSEINIEPLVKVSQFSIVNASFLIRLMANCYDPSQTLFLVIANALNTNTKDRARIMGETKNGFKFVGANTGALNWLIEEFGLKCLYEFDSKNLTGKEFVSFGGKHFHAPMAAKIASGKSMEKLGEKRDKSFLRKFNILDGTIVHIDNFNVAKIKGEIPKNCKEGDKLKVILPNGKKLTAVFTHSMKDLPDNTWAIYPGSSLNNLPEVARVRSLNGINTLGAKVGDVLKFKK